MQRTTLRFVVVAFASILTLDSVQHVSAHEQRVVLDGRYQFVVGFLNEPAVSGEVNSVDLRVSDLSQATPAADGGEPVGAPVEGLEETLTVDIIFADQTRTLDLEPRFQEPGAYNGYVIPVQPGDYAFHIYGTINGEEIDETFTPGPETFSSVLDRATLEFPATSASAGAMTAGSTGGSAGIGRDDLSGGLLAGLAGLLAIIGGGQLLRSRRDPRPVVSQTASAGD